MFHAFKTSFPYYPNAHENVRDQRYKYYMLIIEMFYTDAKW